MENILNQVSHLLHFASSSCTVIGIIFVVKNDWTIWFIICHKVSDRGLKSEFWTKVFLPTFSSKLWTLRFGFFSLKILHKQIFSETKWPFGISCILKTKIKRFFFNLFCTSLILRSEIKFFKYCTDNRIASLSNPITTSQKLFIQFWLLALVQNKEFDKHFKGYFNSVFR